MTTDTVRRVTPQPRGIIPPTQARRLKKATEAKTAADTASTEANAELLAAVVAALKAGGSVRAVAEVTGLSTRTVQDWGHANGWPTKAQKQAREDAKAARREEIKRLGLQYAAEDAGDDE